ncbi:orotidine-5'-phosphate decarboxylase [Kushneria aurantia]|uniref:Orotidine 5'-phosphate decarboxylase n=1 Tax=Kushneria aurantia TaxID=504092 RepID=A0ABV6G7R9_9GAMM|nr:orotidine-5'-phosphate decarboxylase [Kushneria aurantia]
MSTPLIIALDHASLATALPLVDQLDPQRCRLKVGKELFVREGPQAVAALQQRGFEIFLDLKFHDIPNTVAAAVHAAADQGVWMVNVHAAGGRQMMSAARDVLARHNLTTRLIAVTVLTSMDDAALEEVGVTLAAAVQALSLAQLAADSGMDGVVCSAQEASEVASHCGDDFLRVTPGIRPAFAVQDDQRRIMTPASAMAAGSTHLVIGRPITRADDPMVALERIEQELSGE